MASVHCPRAENFAVLQVAFFDARQSPWRGNGVEQVNEVQFRGILAGGNLRDKDEISMESNQTISTFPKRQSLEINVR
jgi:hypothetical protein